MPTTNNAKVLSSSDLLRVDKAFKEGDLVVLRSLVSPEFPNCEIPHGLGAGSPLGYAICQSPLDFIRTLLELGVDPNFDDGDGFPSLIAVLSSPERSDMHEILRLLLEAGADVNMHGLENNTPLHQAVWLDDPVALKMLISHGAHLTERKRIDNYNSPLEEAQQENCQQAIGVLREALEEADRKRRSFPAAPAFSMPYALEDLQSEIDAAFASRSYPGDDNITASQDAVVRFFRGKNWREITMDRVAQVQDVDWSSFLLFMRLEAIEYFLPALLKLALDVSGPVDIGDSLLFYLGKFGSFLIPRLEPVEKQAVVHVMEYLSAEYERRGYTVNLAQRALDDFWADMPIGELKRTRNAERIFAAFRKGDLSTLQTVFEPDFPNCRVSRTGSTCLEYAIRNGPLSLIQALVDLGAEFRDRGTYGQTSLCEALSNPHPEKLEILEYLISLGADVNRRDVGGRTPLHWAAVFNNPAAIDLLVAHGADLHARSESDDGATPLELAEKHVVPSPEAAAALRKPLQREDRL